MMKKSLFLFILITGAFIIPAPKAKAIDPVTLAILAPIAIKAAQTASPYVIKGLANGAKHLVLMGKNTLEILYLPLGVVQTTVGVPFGGLAPGIKNIVQGSIAPFKLTFNALMLPLAFCGAYSGG
jgi:hypothetical protein